ncbi:related to calcineurin catalytic subunit [Serendipita indica DSM 11827]|uniref:Serine/threonine-protein phosphatase n=1 Tax=Serendipita indica (strain DSM 11827) TaxID=1109443 RepID=G4TBH8_SERID|nr:related to calcineurin catalytic subunit [Serendipita indica DSM 11827]
MPEDQVTPATLILSESQLVEHYGVTDLTQRVCKEIRPPDGIASDEDFYRQDNGIPIPNVSFLRLHFYQEGRLTEDQVLFLLRRVGDIFKTERNVLYLSAPITIVGDIHGQYYDLVNFMTSSFGGNPLKTDYLFLGDYVDRGYFSVECLLWLFALKLVKPNGINMLRGNHESKHLTNYFTFRIECTRKYSERIYDAFLEVFKTMPLAAVVDDRFFCVHGGIGPDLESVSDIDKINRFAEVPTKGLFCDLLWADPCPPGSEFPGGPLFLENSVRGCSYYYSYEAVCKFLKANGLSSIIRGHEAQKEGYSMFKYTSENYPSVITIFSAPNYCDIYGNKGAVMTWSGTKMLFKWFYHSPHPFYLPNLADAFTWSLPFVSEKALDMLQAIMNVFEDEQVDTEAATTGLPIGKKGLVMSHIYDLLRQTGPEGASEFRSLPVELTNNLGSAASAVPQLIPDFEHARTSDILNERLPPILVPASEAKEFFARKGVYSLKRSSTQLSRKVSVGTTQSSSPSTRKRAAEVNLALVRQAADLIAKDEVKRRVAAGVPVPSRPRGKLRSRSQEPPTQVEVDIEKSKYERLLAVIDQLRALRECADSAQEMANVLRLVNEEEE